MITHTLGSVIHAPVAYIREFGHLASDAQIFDPHLSIFLKSEMIHIYRGARIDGMVKVEGGMGVHIGPGCHVSSFAHLNIGGGLLFIGENAAITSGAAILSGTNTMQGEAMSSASPVAMQVVERRRTTIEAYAFIGSHAVIYPGVTVGHHAVVKAGAVVTKDVAPWAIVAGVPAKAVGRRVQQEDGTITVEYEADPMREASLP